MQGYQVYKYYIAIRQHFHTLKFNVFTNKGHIKSTLESYEKRNDFKLFEQLSRRFTDHKHCIGYLACNFMYGHDDVIYEPGVSEENYRIYRLRKQSLRYIFKQDLATLNELNIDYPKPLSNVDVVDKFINVVQCYLNNKITFETLSILNQMDSITMRLKNTTAEVFMGDLLLRLDKSHGFISYTPNEVREHKEFISQRSRNG